MVKKISNYILEKLIGQGNYGQVYLGQNILTGAQVAIKSIPTKTLTGKLLQQLECEIKVLKCLRNPYIIQLHDAVRTQNNVYLVMEYCSGGDLSNYLKKVGRVEESQGKKWLSQLIEAFISMQEHHIMHRDLKLANILITHDGDVRVCDFGFARYLSDDLAETQLGTPIYMAPQIFNSEPYNYKADVWSLGVLSYEILVGETAFKCQTLPQLKLLQRAGIKFPEHVLSDSAKDFVQMMLRYDHNERPGFQELKSHPFFLPQATIEAPVETAEEYIDLAEESEEDFELLETNENKDVVDLSEQVLQSERILKLHQGFLQRGSLNAALCVVFYSSKMFQKYEQRAQALQIDDWMLSELRGRLGTNRTEIADLLEQLGDRIGIPTDDQTLGSWQGVLVSSLLAECQDALNSQGEPKEIMQLLAVAIDLEPKNAKSIELFGRANRIMQAAKVTHQVL